MPIREAVYARRGWYPASHAALLQTLETLVPKREDAVPATMVVAPHAGYEFSGGVAGDVYSRVVVPDDAIVLSVNHRPRGPVAQLALFDEGAWETPIGQVPIAADLAQAVKHACPMVEADCEAHADEHSAELHLPFLKYRNPDVQVVPICILGPDLETLREFGRGLARAVESAGRPVLLVASTDMTHFEPHYTATEKDQKVVEKILALDEQGMWDTVRRLQVSMCGTGPVAAGLAYAKERGATTADLVDYKTSGDCPRGDRSQVVGYAGIIIR